MRKFDKRIRTQRDKIRNKFELPEDTSEVYLDKYNRPYELIGGSKVICTVKTNNFHIHENRNK